MVIEIDGHASPDVQPVENVKAWDSKHVLVHRGRASVKTGLTQTVWLAWLFFRSGASGSP